MTITGSGFNYLDKSTLQINFDAAGIQLNGTPTISTDGTQIQVGYSVTCSASVGSNGITVADATQQSNDFGISVVLPNAPAPGIMFGGNNITNTTQSVVIGQQIALSAPPPSLPNCTSLSSQQWTPASAGKPVGGYTNAAGTGPPNTSGKVQPLNETNSTFTFYWVSPGSALNVTYQYTMSGGGSSASSPIATATFDVRGPSSPGVTIQTSSTRIQTVQDASGANMQVASFGPQDSPWPTAGPGSPPGISFLATVTEPSGFSDFNLTWVQVITSGSQNNITGTTTKPCTIPAGIDGPFPYKEQIADADDGPSAKLLTGTYTEQTETVSFSMYLMWDPRLTNSIPIPLGHVNWSWSFDAKFANSAWTIASSSGGPTNTPPFTVSSGFPQWSSETLTPVCNSN